MLSFKDLKKAIISACTLPDEKDRVRFQIDYKKLQNSLDRSEPNKNYNVLGFGNNMSFRANVTNDAQMLQEYLHGRKELDTILGGDTTILEFMIYCNVNENGPIPLEFKNSLGEDFTREELYEIFNTSQYENKAISDMANKIGVQIISKCPIYNTLVVRGYNEKEDKYTYSIYFRSNYNMMTYYKAFSEETEETEEVHEPTVASNE